MANKRTFRTTDRALVSYLGRLRPKQRIKRIDDFIHRLQFERRFTLLTPAELAHMNAPLSREARQKITAAKTETEKDELINGYARARYFRDCAWAGYLNGVTPNKPFDSQLQKTNAA